MAYGQYVWQTFWPANLAPFYPLSAGRLAGLAGRGFGAALLGVSAAAIGARRRFPYLFSGWFWFVGMLVPVIGLVQVGDQAMADRYTYLPQIGLLLALVWGADDLRRWYRLGPRTASISAASIVLALMVCATFQASLWRDGEVLWRHAIDCTTQNAWAHANLGSVLGRRGKTDAALAEFDEAFRIEPKLPGFLRNRGNVYRQARRFDEAIACYRNAIDWLPDEPEFHENLALARWIRGDGRRRPVRCKSASSSCPITANSATSWRSLCGGKERTRRRSSTYSERLPCCPPACFISGSWPRS